MLLTFITTHVFQFRFADAEHYRHPSWLITLTFLHETVVTLPQTAALVITLCLFVYGGFSQFVLCGRVGVLVGFEAFLTVCVVRSCRCVGRL